MKRQRRIRLTGRIDGKHRRRVLRMLRTAYLDRDGDFQGDESRYYDHPEELRDARRLAEAGLAVVVATKTTWGAAPVREVTLFSTVAAAQAQDRPVAPFGRAWSGSSANKLPKKGTVTRASKRRWRAHLAREAKNLDQGS